MRLKRIAYVVNVFPKFSETFIANEIVEVQRRGIEVRILSRRRPQETMRHAVVTDHRLEEITCYGEEAFAPTLRAFRPQLIHAHFATRATDTARRLAREANLSYSFTAHRYDIYDRPPTDFAARCREAGAVITVADANADYMVQQLGATRENLSVIPCGVDTEQFAPVARPPDSPPLLVCVARLHPVKCLPVLLHACARLVDRNVAFRCVVIGEGDARRQIETVRQQLGLERVVELLGAQSQAQVREWWQRAAIGVLSSRSEGMPVSFMEAMASGVPVVGPSVGGIPEMINHGHSGLVVAPNSPAALAAALESLLRDSTLRERMGIAARASALERFSVTAQIDQLQSVWQRILQHRHAA